MDESRIDVINQVFSLFRVNFHNQYYAAYGDSETLNQAKRLWLNSLAPFNDGTLLQATKAVIEQSEYLPTLHRFLETCDGIEYALPHAREAYLEACEKGSTGNKDTWSHPLVYFAAKKTGWHLLRTQPESRAFPAYQRNYLELSRRLREGQEYNLPPPSGEQPAASAVKNTPTRDKQKQRLAQLKAELGLETS